MFHINPLLPRYAGPAVLNQQVRPCMGVGLQFNNLHVVVSVRIIGGRAPRQKHQLSRKMVVLKPIPDVRLPSCGVFWLMARYHSIRKD